MPDSYSDTRPGSTTSHKPDEVLYPETRQAGAEALNDDTLTERMIRRPTEADFADVLSPEGDSGDIVGSDVSNSTTASDISVGGTG